MLCRHSVFELFEAEKIDQIHGIIAIKLKLTIEKKTVELTQITCYKIKGNLWIKGKKPVDFNSMQSGGNQSSNHSI